MTAEIEEVVVDPCGRRTSEDQLLPDLGEHQLGRRRRGDEHGTRVALLTGSQSTSERRRTLLDIVTGDAGIVVGTHALLQENVDFLDLGLVVVPGSRAPFVLVDGRGWLPGDLTPGRLRLRLRERGFAVRRGETFPGLGADWIRIAVRDEATTARLLEALGTLVGRAR